MKAIIEIPQHSIYKYEVNKNTGVLELDRVLKQGVPYNYGFIPETLCDDGDQLDVYVLGDMPIHPLTHVEIEILAVLVCMDNGESDDKLIAKIAGSDWPESNSQSDVIASYLSSYKKGFKVLSFGGKEEAMKIYLDSVVVAKNAQ
jgi:inorganic pyrophosphatase